MRLNTNVYLLVIAGICCGCNRRSDIEERIARIESELYSSRSGAAALEQKVNDLKASNEILKNRIHDNLLQFPSLTLPALMGRDSRFGILKEALGSFPVSLADLDPHLDGFKATFYITNPLSIDIHNLEFVLITGIKDEHTSDPNKVPKGARKTNFWLDRLSAGEAQKIEAFVSKSELGEWDAFDLFLSIKSFTTNQTPR